MEISFICSHKAHYRGIPEIGTRIQMRLVEMFRPYFDGYDDEFGILFTCTGGHKYYWLYPDKESRDHEYGLMCELVDERLEPWTL